MVQADCIVIGAGLTGLQTAIELRARLPRASIMVLERGVLPAGASSRNAGFACFGSLTEILADIKALGESAAMALIERRWRGLQLLRERLGEEAIGYQAFGGNELIRDAQLPALEQIAAINALLRPLFSSDVFSIAPAALAQGGFGSAARALIHNRFEGQLHSGRLMRALAQLARAQGIEILTGANVSAIESDNGGVRVAVDGAPTFRADHVAVCTNALIPALVDSLPSLASGIQPGRGQVIVTEPLPSLPWRGCYHLEEGFYYFRNIGNRVLLGGGRNLDIAGETTTEITITQPIQQALEDLLSSLIIPGRDFTVSHRWSGVMGFSTDKQPVVQRVNPQIVVGFACNGMGVAQSAAVAVDTAALLLA